AGRGNLLPDRVVPPGCRRAVGAGRTAVPAGAGRRRSGEVALEKLKDAARVGIDTVVDLSPLQDMQLYQEIARQVPVKLIACTGSYVYPRMPKWLLEMNEEQMYGRIVKEVIEGISGSKIRAGIIKVAGHREPLTEWEKAAFRAAGRAQKTTGAPVATHAIFEPRVQFELLVQAGADPNRCFFSHTETEFGWAGKSVEQVADDLLSITKEGGYILFNNFGFPFYTPWKDLVFLVRRLCDKGCSNRVLISVDSNWEWKNEKPVFQVSEKHPETARRTFAYMMTDIMPEMLKAGFSAVEMRTFLVDNPRRFFCRAAVQRREWQTR
ncbi:MAG: hypothetical protein L0312_05525, partial [Acidobacteria bacterium]|nr:hypothetical protein [Acidobacteriota bacterium]